MPPPRLRKHLGQHHLVDGKICRPLVEFLAPSGRTVVEIGPGGGVLTRELLAAGARVLAVELDLAWAFTLATRLRGAALEVAVADALDLDWSRAERPLLVTGNLPYNVGTVILERLLPHHATVERAAFLLQKEVVERLVAAPGSKAYGALSVLTAAFADRRLLGRVRPGSFVPPPKVESAFVGLALRPAPLPPAEMSRFLAIVRAAFGQRRKTLRNALAAAWDRERAGQALSRAGIDPQRRPEELSLEEWLALWRAATRTN